MRERVSVPFLVFLGLAVLTLTVGGAPALGAGHGGGAECRPPRRPTGKAGPPLAKATRGALPLVVASTGAPRTRAPLRNRRYN